MEGDCGPSTHSWRTAKIKRKAWALSRDSWQAPESQDRGPEGEPVPEPVEGKASVEESGRVPSKIASWLKECRSPQGASLDEQGSTPTRAGVLRNGCSFEDDLSLGAEANLLQPGGVKACIDGAGERRSHFQQRGLSITSSGSGRSNTTVSSVSELLDLYEEDPEETLYNLGFGTEEPDISTKIPPRFFSSSSSAQGIDIKVYLAAQLQRMELENPNFALTSRFRQIEVLTTVANAFNSLYSQVSGQPVQMIGSSEAEPAEDSPEKKSSSAKNVAKIIKKTLSKHNLLTLAGGNSVPTSSSEDAGKGCVSGTDTEEPGQKNEPKQPKPPRRKDPPWLATVTEETPVNVCPAESDTTLDLVNGRLGSTETHFAVPGSLNREDVLQGEEGKVPPATILDKDSSTLRISPLIAHLLVQPKDSFEMEEVQSNEGEPTSGTHRFGTEHPLRMASQQSDSSGFADDPSTDGSTNFLKVQESSDSCDSENTVKSNSFDQNIPLGHPVFEKLLGSTELLTVVSGTDSINPQMLTVRQNTAKGGEEVPSDFHQQLSKPADGVTLGPTVETGPISVPLVVTAPTAEPISVPATKTGPTAEPIVLPVVEPRTVAESEVTTEPLGLASDKTEPTAEPVGLTSAETEPNAEPVSLASAETGLTTEHDSLVADSTETMVDGPLSSDLTDNPEGTFPVYSATLATRGRSTSLQKFPLRRSSSLPTSLLNPSCVVSTVKIQIHPGGMKQCTPPTFSYRYTPEEEEEREATEEDEGSAEEGGDSNVKQEIRSSAHTGNCPSRAKSQQMDENLGRIPHNPLHMPPHLRESSCSLHSQPPNWPQRPLGEHSQSWTTCSVPNLHHLGNSYRWPQGCLNSAPSSVSRINPLCGSYDDFRGSPNSFPCICSQNSLYCNYQCPSYSLPHRDPYSNRLYDHLSSPHPPHCCHSFPYGPMATPPRPVHTPSCTEMQLRRVLHDIRNTVQNLAQCSSSSHDGLFSPASRTQRSDLLFCESTLQELQGIQRSLNAFRAQMTNLELALVREQCSVYQHLSEDERQEEMQLLQLRSAVRQELQELELQLEDRLLSLDEQLRSFDNASLYRHPMSHSIESLSSVSSLNITRPGLEALREQLGSEGRQSVDCSDPSSPSSWSASPGRSTHPRGPNWDRQPQTPERSCSPRAGIYRASVCLTPAPPTRLGMTPAVDSAQPKEPSPAPAGISTGERGDSPQLQQLIQQVRETIAEEVRQQILTDLLAAVSPKR